MKSSVLLKGWQRSLGQAIANLDREQSKALGNSKQRSRENGFTLLEVLIVLLMVGILSAIAAPGWLAFINNQRLRTSQSRVYGAMQLAQSNAKRDKVAWQASFRVDPPTTGVVQVAVHRATDNLNLNNFSVNQSGGNTFSENTWINLEDKVAIDTDKTNFITVDPATNTVKTSGGGSVYAAIFNRQGCFVDDATKECTDPSTVTGFNKKGLITLKHSQLGSARRCAAVETLLGAMRTGDDKDNCNP